MPGGADQRRISGAGLLPLPVKKRGPEAVAAAVELGESEARWRSRYVYQLATLKAQGDGKSEGRSTHQHPVPPLELGHAVRFFFQNLLDRFTKFKILTKITLGSQNGDETSFETI